MRIAGLALRSLRWYWRTNIAVVAGVALATAVLSGALAVGDSVRASLRKLALGRLGATDMVLSSRGFFREALAGPLGPGAPLIVVEAFVVNDRTRKAAARVAVYGIDERFYRFHGVVAEELSGNRLLLSPELARQVDAQPGDALLLRLEAPSAIPREFLHGRRDSPGKTTRLTVAGPVSPGSMGEFSLRAEQGEVRAAFVDLRRLQRELDRRAQVNTILLKDMTDAPRRLRAHFQLVDAGLSLRHLDSGHVALEHASTLLDDRTASIALEAGQALGLQANRLFTYLANGIRANGRMTPYSLVTAVHPSRGVIANEWLAKDLKLRPDDEVELEYFVWGDEGQMRTGRARLRLSETTPLTGWALDRDAAPSYPGITNIDSVADWDPPFPMDLKRVRPIDEEYWKKYRATPKLWIPLEVGQKLWGTRYGKLTAIRFFPADARLEEQLRQSIDPLAGQFMLMPVRAQQSDAASGSTDFGEYFLYFSFFVILSALLLTSLFFRLGVEQRVREIGTLKALGFQDADVRRALLWEGLALSSVGVIVGSVASFGYAALLVYGLRTWWVDAVGTRLLEVHLSATSLIAGAGGAFLTAMLSIVWGFRGFRRATPRGLMSGRVESRGVRWRKQAAAGCAIAALALVGGGAAGRVPAAAAFFGAGVLLLSGLLTGASVLLRAAPLDLRTAPGTLAIAGLGLRNAGWRPGRSVLSMTLIAVATFLIVSLESFRRGSEAPSGRFTVLAEAQVPLINDPNSSSGREALNLAGIAPLDWEMFRLRPGDDVSCLNLYAPKNPRILGARSRYLRENHLEAVGQGLIGGAIPAAVDANSLAYVLHKKVGEEFRIERESAPAIRLRIVAAPKETVFQSEIIIAEENFRAAFPEIPGYRVFLIAGAMDHVAELEEVLSDYGFDATSVAARLAAYHRVENTYLSTFQALGALGLLLGTVGLAAVLLRNALERRRELGMLRALGYSTQDLAWLVLSENLILLGGGLTAGMISALVSVAPAIWARDTGLAGASLAAGLLIILAAGVVVSRVASGFAVRGPLVAAIRSE